MEDVEVVVVEDVELVEKNEKKRVTIAQLAVTRSKLNTHTHSSR